MGATPRRRDASMIKEILSTAKLPLCGSRGREEHLKRMANLHGVRLNPGGHEFAVAPQFRPREVAEMLRAELGRLQHREALQPKT
jgi:hypothetical protein